MNYQTPSHLTIRTPAPAQQEASQLAALSDAGAALVEFSFDFTLTAAISVKALSRAQAESQIRKVFDAACCNGGAWPDGEPVLFEASINDAPLALFGVDGNDVSAVVAPQTHVGALMAGLFVASVPADVDGVIGSLLAVPADAKAAGEDFEHRMRIQGCVGEAAVFHADCASDSGFTVADAQAWLRIAMLADGFSDWPAGSAATRLVPPESAPSSGVTASNDVVIQRGSDEHATILAALRYYQEQGMGDPFNRSDSIHDIATNGGEVFSSLDAEGIDRLCEQLNSF